jgi:hypothetical protein
MSVEKYMSLLNQLGRAKLNALYPNDFEYYMIGLELVDSEEKVVEYLVFPVNPSNISQTEPNLNIIRKTFGGVSSFGVSSFIPRDITISGDFGRKFKILVGREIFTFSGFTYSSVKNAVFDMKVKTGYGCIKILQNICRQSLKPDSKGRSHRLYFYNPTLSESYLVKVMGTGLILNMTQDKNMIWSYSLPLKLLLPLEGVKQTNENSLSELLTIGSIQKTVNTVASEVSRILL